MNSEADVLLALYRAARTEPTAAFQARAVQLVQPLLRFESAVWATGTLAGTRERPALVPILSLSYTFATDPAGVAHWREINGADKAIPIMLAHPQTTCCIHSPTLFAEAGDAAMRDYTRRFGRQCALVTGLAAPRSPLIEWSVFYRPDADDPFSEAERSLCERLMAHLSEALRLHRLAWRTGEPAAEADAATQEASAVVTRQGRLLAAGPSFLARCASEWPQFDGTALPPHALRHLLGDAPSRFFGAKLRLDARPLAELWWITAGPAGRVAGRRMNVAALFASGRSCKAIARLLDISPATVRNHVATSYRELGASNRTELAARLREQPPTRSA